MARKTHPEEPEIAVAVVQVSLLIPGCRSLKEKRSVVKGLLERARHKFNASIAEVGGHATHQRAEVGAALVANDRRFLSAEADQLLSYFRGCPDARVVDHQVEIL